MPLLKKPACSHSPPINRRISELRLSARIRPSLFRAALFLSIFLWPAGHLFAEDFYVAQNTLGNGSGTSAANAKSVGWFNTTGNWSSPTKIYGRIGPGDTVRLVGTVTTPLTFQAGGLSNQPITLLFEAGARMSSPAWPGSGAIVVNGHHHVTIDGGQNGLIENTANGSAGSYPHQVGSIGVSVTSDSHLTIKHLAINNLYVRTSKADKAGGGQGIRVAPPGGGTVTALRIIGCAISDVETGITLNYRVIEVTDVEIAHNTITQVNHGIRVGDAQSGSRAHDIRIHNNRIFGFSKWDEPDSNAFHHNGIFCFAVNEDSQLHNVHVYSNHIGSDFGAYATSGIYFNGRIFGSAIYNNLLIGDPNTPANGLVTMRLREGSTVDAFNNTFIGNGSSGRAFYLNGADSGGKTVRLYNNLATRITFIAVTFAERWSLKSDYNLGYDLVPNREYSYSQNSTGSFRTFARWQELGYDVNSLVDSDPLLDSTHRPQPGSPALSRGTNLSTIFDADMNGTPRGQGSAWGIGALLSSSSSASSRVFSPWEPLSGDQTLQAPWRRNAVSGRQIWTLNGNSPTGALALNTTDPAWEIATAADFNRDGRADLIWQNRNTGERRVWLMSEGTTTSIESWGSYDPQWEIRTAADFNGDGLLDLAVQHSASGRADLWLMDGARIALGVDLGETDGQWRLVATADFDGDQNPDLLWQHRVSGEARLWLMQRTSLRVNVPLGGQPAGWRAAATGDFDRDGHADIFWQQPETGERLVWLMDRTMIRSIAPMASADQGWLVAGAGDFTGDGQTDLVANAAVFTTAMMAPESAPTTTASPGVSTLSGSGGTGDGGGGGSTHFALIAALLLLFTGRLFRF